LHKDWLDIKSVDVSVQNTLSNLFSSSRAQKEKLENKKSLKSSVAFAKYYNQGGAWKSDHQAYLMPISRSDIPPHGTPAATKPGILQLNPGPSSGLTCNHRSMGLNIGLLCLT